MTACRGLAGSSVRALLATLIVVAVAVGCGPTLRTGRSFDMSLAGESRKNLEGVAIRAKVVDYDAATKDPRLSTKVPVTIKRLGAGEGVVEIPFALAIPPIFEVSITNNTGHVLRMQGVVIRLVDAAGTVYEPTDKARLEGGLPEAIQAVKKELAKQTVYLAAPIDDSSIRGGIRRLRLLGPNSEILPGMTEAFFVAFDARIPPTSEAYTAWMQTQSTLTLKIFEVPSKVDETGKPTKRVHFDFPVEVAEYVDTWHGSERVKRQRVRR